MRKRGLLIASAGLALLLAASVTGPVIIPAYAGEDTLIGVGSDPDEKLKELISNWMLR